MELSLQNFRDAVGKLNRGYLKVDGETVVKQGNSAIGSFFGVGKSGTAEQNREIREGLVKALHEAGANEAFLENVRAQLGLTPESPTARTLLKRKLVAKILNDFDAQKLAMMPDLHGLEGSSKLAHTPEAMKMRQQAVRLLANFTKLPVGEIDVLSNKTLAKLSDLVRVGGITDAVKLKEYLLTLTKPKLQLTDAEKILAGLETRYTSETALAMVDNLENRSQELPDVIDTKVLHQTKEDFEIVNDTPAEVAARLNGMLDQIHNVKKGIAHDEAQIASFKQKGELLTADRAKAQAEMEEARGLTDEAIGKLPVFEQVGARWKKSKLSTGAYEKDLKRLDAQLADIAEAVSLVETDKAQLEASLSALEEQHQKLLVGKNPVLDAEQKKATQSFEQKVRAFAADICSSDATWEMDRAGKNPAARLKALFTKNADLITTMLDMPEEDFKTLCSDDLADVMGKLIGSIREKVTSSPLYLGANKIAKGAVGACFRKGLSLMGDEVFADINSKIEEIINEKSKDLSKEMKELVDQALGVVSQKTKDDGKTRLGKLKDCTLDDLVHGAVDVTQGYGKFMKDAMTQYFDKAPMSIKRQMFAAAIRYMDYQKPLDPNLPDEELKKENTCRKMMQMGAMLKGAGPILQKMMQGLSEMPINDELKLALKDMKSNLAPIPEKMVKAHLQSVVDNSNGKIKAIKVTKSLGAASVGQTFLCTMTNVDDQGHDVETEVVVKLLRPDVQARAEAEKQIFFDVAEGGMKNTFSSQLEGIMAEMDLTKEADNVVAGQIYTGNPFNGIAAMKLHPLAEATPSIMVLEKAPGTTVDRFLTDTKAKCQDIVKDLQVMDASKKPVIGFKSGTSYIAQLQARKQAFNELKDLRRSLETKQEKLLELSRKWVQEALFGSGLFHGDMHGGNIMIDDNPVAAENKGVTILDFGNAHKLSQEDQKSVLLMVGAASTQDTNRFLDGFRALLPPESRAEFDRKRAGEGTDEHPSLHAIVHAIFYKDGTTCKQTGERIFACLQELQKEGIELPGAINNFSQSQIRLQGMIDQVNNQIKEVGRLMNQVAKDVSDGNEQPFDMFMPTFGGGKTDFVLDEFKANQRRVVQQNDDNAQDSGITLYRDYMPLTEETEEYFQKKADEMAAPERFAALKKDYLDILMGTDQSKVQDLFTSLRQYTEGKFEPFSTDLQHVFNGFQAMSREYRPELCLSFDSKRAEDLKNKLKGLEDTKNAKIEALNKKRADMVEMLKVADPEVRAHFEISAGQDIQKAEKELVKLQKRIDTLTEEKNDADKSVEELEGLVARNATISDKSKLGNLEILQACADEVVTIYLNAQKAMLEDLAKTHADYRKEIAANKAPHSFFGMMADLLRDNMRATVFSLGATGLKWVLGGKISL